MIDCSVCGRQALGRRTTNNGQPCCFGCQAAARVDAALTCPDGAIRPELQPVRDALAATSGPRSLLTNWHSLAGLHLLTEIAQGRISLTHETLDARPQTFSVTYLRSVLVATGALPPRDENTARLHHYAAQIVAEIDDVELRGVLTRYARWHVVRRAKTNRHGLISAATAAGCRHDIQKAKAFVDHLTTHEHTLDNYSQSCLDAWLARDHGKRLGFLRWLTHSGYLTRCQLPAPAPQKNPGHDIDPSSQLDLARQFLHDPDSASVEDRAAACLILLYAQPIAKIATLTTTDIHIAGSDTFIRLGREPLLLIPPLDTLVTALPAAKPFGTASALADKRWLFTGKNAGTHLAPASLMRRMHNLGITARASRNTALLHLASTTPPAVFAHLIGISIGTATHWAELSGSAWNNYAAARR
ncbi:hypothetical protein ACFVFJ_47060 [Streptomyces sp. NPDC057717]|uniref:hypothetical protein n=1 Tax=Streptomyces sp. NPDC057717 TaxID=3346224 RepID=UPI0036A336BB